jgi:hypothetical protein
VLGGRTLSTGEHVGARRCGPLLQLQLHGCEVVRAGWNKTLRAATRVDVNQSKFAGRSYLGGSSSRDARPADRRVVFGEILAALFRPDFERLHEATCTVLDPDGADILGLILAALSDS